MSREVLMAFIGDRFPELDKAMGSMPMDDVRQVLNAATGLLVHSCESITDSCDKFHRKLIEMEAAGTLYLVGLDAAMKEVQRLRTI